MARHGLNDPMVKVITNQLANLVLREGSVNGALRALAAVLHEDRGEGRLHANRLHTLLSDDPAKSVNTETLETVRLALSRLAETHPAGDSPGGVEQPGRNSPGDGSPRRDSAVTSLLRAGLKPGNGSSSSGMLFRRGSTVTSPRRFACWPTRPNCLRLWSGGSLSRPTGWSAAA